MQLPDMNLIKMIMFSLLTDTGQPVKFITLVPCHCKIDQY